jgi:glycosyltransferase involved in cell wall biosynthesis
VRIIYVASARLPTEKAHGYQIVSMCEAFAEQGVELELVYPTRHQFDPALRQADLHAYYGVAPSFRVRELASPDPMPWVAGLSGAFHGGASLLRSYYWAWQVAHVLASESAPDIYYTRDAAVALCLTRRGAPVVFEGHTVPRRLQRPLYRRLCRRPSLVLTAVVTRFIREGLLELGFPPDRVVVHPDAVDLRRFRDLPDIRGSRRTLGLDVERPIVGYIGRFTALGLEKGIAELIDAVAAVRRESGLDVMLLCVGGPLDRVSEYRRRAEAQGLPASAFRFLDRVPPAQVPLWMRACDVATIPWSWNEFSAYFTSPLKLFEYLAAGLPIVASDLPSLREVLMDGENALLVEPGSPSALAAGMLKVLVDTDMRRRLAANARSTAARYTWSGRAASILAELPTTLAQRRRSNA